MPDAWIVPELSVPTVAHQNMDVERVRANGLSNRGAAAYFLTRLASRIAWASAARPENAATGRNTG